MSPCPPLGYSFSRNLALGSIAEACPLRFFAFSKREAGVAALYGYDVLRAFLSDSGDQWSFMASDPSTGKYSPSRALAAPKSLPATTYSDDNLAVTPGAERK